ncbi:class A beta-lactamase [Trinickia sp. LjRoot230]|uniref:class A beta-lactamase n=1 Tax=Trinickia sp. LjRoot230 TaxID=3342288 RepID=UPI003ECDE5AF
MMQRRRFIGTVMGGLVAGLSSASLIGHAARHAAKGSSARPAGYQTSQLKRTIEAQLGEIEARVGGRLGVVIFDPATGFIASRRASERFPLCSTFKLLAAAAVLERTDRHVENLERRIVFSKAELETYSPVTSHRTGGNGMTVGELCDAAVTLSDNTAANLLLASLGGPAGITAFARSLGDTVTRLDRNEPTLNESLPDDPRDTTTPTAMVSDLRELLLGDRLSSGSRAQLLAWLAANRTGGARLRAGLPPGWRVGDKTGTGERGSTNDVGIMWPPTDKPLLVAAYLTATTAPEAQRNAALASVGRLAASIVA